MRAELVSEAHARLAALEESSWALLTRYNVKARPKKGSRCKSGKWWRRRRRHPLENRDYQRYREVDGILTSLRLRLGVPIPVVAD